MFIDLDKVTALVAQIGEQYEAATSFTIELYSIPGVGARQHGNLWIHNNGNKTNVDVFGLLESIVEERGDGTGQIKFDLPT